ncbi:MAG: undecaprenyl-phosphate glucose phosphotransferase [Acidobacteriota bacterium]
MDGIRRSFYYIFLFFDIIILLFSFSAADIISRSRLSGKVLSKIGTPGLPEIFTILIFIIVWLFSARITSLYDELKNFNFGSEIFTFLKNISIQLIVGVVILFALKDILLSRFFLMLYILFTFFGTLFLRIVYRLIKRELVRSGKLRKNILMIGSSDFGRDLFGSPERASAMGYNISGFITENSNTDKPGSLGTYADINDVIAKFDIDEVLITLNAEESEELDHIIRILSGSPVRVRVIPEYFKLVSNKYQVSFFNNILLIDIRNDPLDELHWRVIKRGFDIIFSLMFILLIYSWLGLLISIAVKISSRGPVHFKQERWGRKNKKFTLYKFRSMVRGSRDLDTEGKFVQATKNDSRITPLGKFLRKTSLDELPQFFNVLKGNMSVIGPRPHAIPMNIESKDKIENYMLRHLVKPGITGWAQVNGYRGETSTSNNLEKRVEFDMFYIENWSLWFDLRIIFLTLWQGVRGDPNAY